MPDPILVVDYSPSWPAAFEALRSRAARALGDLALAIVHVGSTSVPGLAAKPVIDLEVVVKSRDDVPAAIRQLATLGYVHEGDQGIPGRESFRWPAGEPRHHLYLEAAGAPPLRRHLAFRDYLRTHPETAAEYDRLKRGLARQFEHDRSAYTDAKTEFVTKVLGVAEAEAGQASRATEHAIQGLARGFTGRLGVWAHHLESGQELTIGADASFDTASVIKLAVMYEVFRQVEAGAISLDDPMVLDRGNMVPGSGILKDLDEGHRLSLREALTLMLVVSDNSATNLCIDRVGGWDVVNASMDTLGLARTRLHKKVFLPSPKASGPGLGATTPREMGSLLLRIAQHEVLTPASCDQALTILGRQQFKDMLARDIDEWTRPDPGPDAASRTANADTAASSIAASATFIPRPYRLANKGGWVKGVRNEVGLFTTPRGRYVISVFTNDSQDPRFNPTNEGVLLVGRVSRLVYDLWGRV